MMGYLLDLAFCAALFLCCYSLVASVYHGVFGEWPHEFERRALHH